MERMIQRRGALGLALALVLCGAIVAFAAAAAEGSTGSRCEGGVCAQTDLVVELTPENEAAVLRAPLVLVELCTNDNPACTDFAAEYAGVAQELAGVAVVAHADAFGRTEFARKNHADKTPHFLLLMFVLTTLHTHIVLLTHLSHLYPTIRNGTGPIPYLEEPNGASLVRWVASYADYHPVLLQSAGEVAAFIAAVEDERSETPLVACFDPLPLQPGASADAALFESTLFTLGAQKGVAHAYVQDPALINATHPGVAVLHSRAFNRTFVFDFGDTAALQAYADQLASTDSTSVSKSEGVTQQTKTAALAGFIESRRLPPFGAVAPTQLQSYHASGLPVFFVVVRKTPRAGFRSWFERLAVNNSDRFLVGYLDMFAVPLQPFPIGNITTCMDTHVHTHTQL